MEKVILLHGIFLHEYMMNSLAKNLRKNGYEVLNVGYPSRRHTIRELTQIVKQKVAPTFESSDKIHLVGFSMGGLIWRSILAEIQPKNVGRLVMIATPNNGSEVADRLHKNTLVKFFYGPALEDLQTTSANKIPSLIDSQIEFGIIAGNKPSNSLFNSFFTSENDGTVAVQSTHHTGKKDHIVLPFDHTFAPFYNKVQQQTLHFLKNGNFQH